MYGLKTLPAASGSCRLLILGLAAILLTGCTMVDENDVCCYQALLRYHETVYGTDRFRDDVQSTRHFLFAQDGRFVMECYPDVYDRQQVSLLDLPYGQYTMVTVANATDRTLLENIENLSAFRLRMAKGVETRRGDDVEYGNADELFWNMENFAISEVPFERDCELANIHCHLHVYVRWKSLPRSYGDYVMKLFQVPEGYWMAMRGDSIRGTSFPHMLGQECTHAMTESPYNFEVRYDVVTHRYRDNALPVMQLFIGDAEATGLIDLSRAFQWWDWHPDDDTEQEYWIQVEVQDDGTALVNKWDARGRVLDWIDGGTISR